MSLDAPVTTNWFPSNPNLIPNPSDSSLFGLLSVWNNPNTPFIFLYTNIFPWSVLSVSAVGALTTTKLPLSETAMSVPNPLLAAGALNSATYSKWESFSL